MATGRDSGRVQPRQLLIVIGLLIALSMQPAPGPVQRPDPRPVISYVLPRRPRRRRGCAYRRLAPGGIPFHGMAPFDFVWI